jgi:hypothetical protein
VRQPLEVGECRTGGGADEGDDVHVGGRVQAGGLGKEGAGGVADARRRAGDADRAGLGERLEDRHVVDLAERSTTSSRRSTYDGIAASRLVDSATVLRLGAVPSPRRTCRNDQCSGRRVHTRGPAASASAQMGSSSGTSPRRTRRSVSRSARGGWQPVELLLEAVFVALQLRAPCRRGQPGAEHEQR